MSAFERLRLEARALAFAVGCAAVALACANRSSATDEARNPSAADAGVATEAKACDAAAAEGLAVKNEDDKGFPPYAVHACTLVYVKRSGELVARDLATGFETIIAPASEHPRRPSMSAALVAWEADDGTRSVVRVRMNDAVKTITGDFAVAGEPRVNDSSVAFTGWKEAAPTSDSDVWLYDARSGEARRVLDGAGQQRFPDVSEAFVAAADYSEDPDGRADGNGRDLANIVLFDRAAGAVVRREREGKQSFPMLGRGDTLAYLDWNEVHPEPKLEAYALRVGTVRGSPSQDRFVVHVDYSSGDSSGLAYPRPAVLGDAIEWVSDDITQARRPLALYRAPMNGSAPPSLVRSFEGLRVYAPAPTTLGGSNAPSGFTVLATADVDNPEIAELRAIPR